MITLKMLNYRRTIGAATVELSPYYRRTIATTAREFTGSELEKF